MRGVITIFGVLLATGFVGARSPLPAAADDGDDDDETSVEIDYVALAARLLQDGHYDRAEHALHQANTRARDFDLQRYQTLLGVVSLKKKSFEAARAAFERAIEVQLAAERQARADAEASKRRAAIRPDPLLLLYLAQSAHGMQDYRGVLAVLKRAAGAIDDEVGVHLMRSQAHWELGQAAQALSALRRGAARFPAQPEFLRLQIFYLIELELYQEAMQLGQRYLRRRDVEAADYVAVGEALRKGKQLAEAGVVLEGAHLRFPYDPQVMLALAHVYIDRGQPLAAGMLLEEAARFDRRFSVQAAELYKRAGRLSRALSINAAVVDQKEKLEQRLGILLEMERFELVAAMAPSLSREGLLQDDSVRYALAYGFYRIGDFESAERHLKRITEVTWLDNANQLRRAMQNCRSDGWECT